MNINRFNYKRALPLMVQSFRQSDFIAFDFEFSGLHSDQALLGNHLSDSVALRYWKHRENVQKFIPLQIGLCAFKFTPSEDEETADVLECMPFNINILPFVDSQEHRPFQA